MAPTVAIIERITAHARGGSAARVPRGELMSAIGQLQVAVVGPAASDDRSTAPVAKKTKTDHIDEDAMEEEEHKDPC